MRKSKLKIGEILLNEGLINQSQIDEALKFQKLSGRSIGDILVDRGLIRENDLSNALAKQLDIPFVSIKDGSLKPSEDNDLDKIIPQYFARSHMVLPLSKHLKSLTVAIANPLDLLLMDNLKKMTGCDINPVIATKADIREMISRFYGAKDLLEEAVDSSYDITEAGVNAFKKQYESESLEDIVSKAEEAPIIKLVNLLLIQAVKDRASDIHIEPFKEKINVRFRIDGILHQIAPPSQHLLPALISRIKILSKMDIAEKRLPQDGGFTVKIEDRPIDLRVSVIPTLFGEKAVMRILDKGAVSFELDKLGFSEKHLNSFKSVITRPYGLIFVTGPTGSGKSTTLYSALNHIMTPKKNIMTIEDPVEYQLSGINQVQVKPNIGLTFAEGLRSFLRQDPDIMMVGEVRDIETASICIRASLTGHLVLSTLHTNDAPSAITRLTDIGVEPYLVASSLLLIMAQRLVRRLCPKCKACVKMPDAIADRYGITKRDIFEARGCEYCKNTGYSGRVAIHELLEITPELRQLIADRAAMDMIRQAAKKSGMRTLVEDGLSKIMSGTTSVEEVMSSAFE
ncbi:MAG: type II secretion system ATPase GspE [Candidatus Omnitrophica bacterium]|jgi:type IV pilus assembly protein PilB|nr:type II secretion system ATPase GspE [Candidatus Omnitrophota bacterium]